MESKILAKKIWDRVLNNLYGSAKFDWWWDRIDGRTREQLNQVIVGIIEEEIDNATSK